MKFHDFICSLRKESHLQALQIKVWRWVLLIKAFTISADPIKCPGGGLALYLINITKILFLGDSEWVKRAIGTSGGVPEWAGPALPLSCISKVHSPAEGRGSSEMR